MMVIFPSEPLLYSTKTFSIVDLSKKDHFVDPSRDEIAMTLFGLVRSTRIFSKPNRSAFESPNVLRMFSGPELSN